VRVHVDIVQHQHGSAITYSVRFPFVRKETTWAWDLCASHIAPTPRQLSKDLIKFLVFFFLTFECCMLLHIYLILHDAVNRNKVSIH
jgi:hypothetical protein